VRKYHCAGFEVLTAVVMKSTIFCDITSCGPKGLDVGGRIILEWMLERWDWGGMDWIDLAQDRDQWRALVNTVMNLGAP
jgi:hypothetical protein